MQKLVLIILFFFVIGRSQAGSDSTSTSTNQAEKSSVSCVVKSNGTDNSMELQATVNAPARVKVYDLEGKLIANEVVDPEKPNVIFRSNSNSYYVIVTVNAKTTAQKISVETPSVETSMACN